MANTPRFTTETEIAAGPSILQDERHHTMIFHTEFTVRIEPKGWTFTTPEAVPLLEAARRSAINLPSSCRNGTCRACMCRLLSGQIRYQIEWPGLSSDEKKDGYILPCIAYPQSDLVIEEPRATALPTSR
jgi:ferredoxin